MTIENCPASPRSIATRVHRSSHGVFGPIWTCPSRTVGSMARRQWEHTELVTGVREGDRRALARAISLVENSDPRAQPVVRELYPETGRTYAVGVTGPPGVGKSSLVGALIGHARGLGLRLGVVS